MAKKQTATQPQPLPNITPESAEPQPTVDAGSIGESSIAPKQKDIAVLITVLHTAWDDITAHGYNAEAEFMAVINSKLSGKTHEEVKAIAEQSQQQAVDPEAQAAAEAGWQERNAAYRAEAAANLQTRIDRPKKNSRR
jgi:hypothetical protein